MHERGLVMREVKKLYTQAPECTSKGSNFRSAGILDLYSVYMLFFMGLAASVGLLILEIIAKKLIEPRIIKCTSPPPPEGVTMTHAVSFQTCSPKWLGKPRTRSPCNASKHCTALQ